MISKEKLIKKYEDTPARELVKASISALQGVSEADAAKMKEAFGIDNISEMAQLRFYKRAKAIKALAGEDGK
ncbi:MAG: hypothetical protein Q4B42_05290 [Oscillospiraceae bacterium]|nr:hypothetical protein [Oscillospiraceae bacterium]